MMGISGCVKMNKEKDLEVLTMLRDYVNEN